MMGLATGGVLAVLVFAYYYQRQQSWVGEFVIHTKPAKEIRIRAQVGQEHVFLPFTGIGPTKVRDECDEQLLIHDGHHEGWVDKANFVLVRNSASHFDERVKANSKDTFALYMRGLSSLRRGDLDKAISDFDECIRRDANDAFAFTSRGIAWGEKKDYDREILDYTKAIELDPTFALAFNNRGLAWSDKGEFDKAIREYDEAIRLDPVYPAAFKNRAIAWGRMKEYEKAIVDYDHAIRLDRKYADAFYGKAACYACQDRVDPAIDNLRRSFELGLREWMRMERDRDFDSIRSDPRYKQLQREYAK